MKYESFPIALTVLPFTPMATIYDRIGGETAIMIAVPLFYAKVLADERVARFFDGLDMDKQTSKQVAFMSRAFGGPTENHGKALGPAHRELVEKQGLGDEHFDAIVELLDQTLDEMGVEEALRVEISSTIGGLRNEVLSR